LSCSRDESFDVIDAQPHMATQPMYGDASFSDQPSNEAFGNVEPLRRLVNVE